MSRRVFLSCGFFPAFVGTLVALGAAGQRASGQSVDRGVVKDDDRAARIAEMKQIAGSFQAVVIANGARTEIPLLREPLHRWSDPTRANNDGALWAWRSAGRPIAIMAIELYPQDRLFGTVWALEFTSLSAGPITIEGGDHFDIFYPDIPPPLPGGRLRWAPSKGGLEFREISEAPAPAKNEAGRLRQMRELLKRFAAREYYNVKGQGYALRLLPHPIDRYADAASGVVDGAIFLFANGTNPEVVLVIEARRRGEDVPAWSYAAAPLTRAKPTLRLANQDVWTYPFKDVPSPEDTYFIARRPRRLPGSSASPR
jgi:hypothetical protein